MSHMVKVTFIPISLFFSTSFTKVVYAKQDSVSSFLTRTGTRLYFLFILSWMAMSCADLFQQ